MKTRRTSWKPTQSLIELDCMSVGALFTVVEIGIIDWCQSTNFHGHEELWPFWVFLKTVSVGNLTRLFIRSKKGLLRVASSIPVSDFTLSCLFPLKKILIFEDIFEQLSTRFAEILARFYLVLECPWSKSFLNRIWATFHVLEKLSVLFWNL